MKGGKAVGEFQPLVFLKLLAAIVLAVLAIWLLVVALK